MTAFVKPTERLPVLKSNPHNSTTVSPFQEASNNVSNSATTPILQQRHDIFPGKRKTLDGKDTAAPRVWAASRGAIAEESASKPDAWAKPSPTNALTANQTKILSPYLLPPTKAKDYLPVCPRTMASRRPKLPSVDGGSHASCPDQDMFRRDQGNPSGTTAKKLQTDSPHNAAPLVTATSSMSLPSVYLAQTFTGGSAARRRRCAVSYCGEEPQKTSSKRPPWQSISGAADSLWGPSRNPPCNAPAPPPIWLPKELDPHARMAQSNPTIRVGKLPSPFAGAAGHGGGKLQVATLPDHMYDSASSPPAAGPRLPMGSRGGTAGDLEGLLWNECHADAAGGGRLQPVAVVGSEAPLRAQQQMRAGAAASQGAGKATPQGRGDGLLPSLSRPLEPSGTWLAPDTDKGGAPDTPEPDAGPPSPALSRRDGPATPPLYSRRLSTPSMASPPTAAADRDGALPALLQSFKRVWSAEVADAGSESSELAEESPGSRFLGRHGAIAFKRRAEPLLVDDSQPQQQDGEQGSAPCTEEQEVPCTSEAPEESPGSRFLGRHGAIAFKRRAEPTEAEDEPSHSTVASEGDSQEPPDCSRHGSGVSAAAAGEAPPAAAEAAAVDEAPETPSSAVALETNRSSSADSRQADTQAQGQADNAKNDVTVDGVRILGQKYEMLSIVGEGSYGVVLKCKVSDGSGRHVAIKSFKIDNKPDADVVKRTSKRETAMLRALQHPNVVRFEDMFYARDRLFIVMEYVPETLLSLLDACPGGMSGDAVRPLMRQLCTAIAFIHSKNAVYRDIKPENMLIDQGVNLKLCDFGFARFMNAPGEALTDYVATRWYRAPELLLGPPFLDGSETVQYMYGPPTDMWAIGCLMAELLTGEPLFPGDSEIDQLHLITKLLGPLIPEHRSLFDQNPLNAGVQLDVKEEASLTARYRGKMTDVELEFLAGLLCMDPQRRLTGQQCLQHPYLAAE